MNVYLIAAPGADVATTVLPLIRDAASEFAGAYPTDERTAFAVGPTATSVSQAMMLILTA